MPSSFSYRIPKKTEKSHCALIRLSRHETNRSRICYMAPDVPIPSPRGSAVHVTELAKSLVVLGHEVHVICRRARQDEAKEEEYDGFTIHRIRRSILKPGGQGSSGLGAGGTKPLRDRIYYFYLRTIFSLFASIVAVWLMRKYKLDTILERETSFGAGAIASLFTGKPMILEIVGPRYSRLSVWRSERILFYTDSMLRKWVDRTKCVRVAAGVNLEVFRRDDEQRKKIREKLGFESREFILGYVGTFQDWHGIETLLLAVASLRLRVKNLRVLLVGPIRSEFENQSKKLLLSDVCTFVGSVDYSNVPAYINACDVMLALYEPSKDPLRQKYGIGWPLKILEYMACAKPVISTRIDPINRIIYDESLGVLIEPGSVSELERAVETLYSNRKMSQALSENGNSLVRAKYSWSSVAEIVSPLMH
jgi:glycosyltransferase involved in cell wall biosynthesis